MGVPFNSSLIEGEGVEKGFGAVIDRIEAAWAAIEPVIRILPEGNGRLLCHECIDRRATLSIALAAWTTVHFVTLDFLPLGETERCFCRLGTLLISSN